MAKGELAVRQGRRLGRADWTEAALAAVADGGLTAISVERLAGQLGATKGSFYWHFSDKRALIDAALEAWEQQETYVVLRDLERRSEPADQLSRLLHAALDDRRGGRIESALMASLSEPAVAAVVERATVARIAFLRDLFTRIGAPDAAHRAVFAYSAYVGLLQLRRAAPGVAPAGTDLGGYVASVIERLIGGAAAPG
jgi:AcrR family transcriptional regulator